MAAKPIIKDALCIRIFPHSEGGYEYSIYASDDWDADAEPVDGGLCTSTLQAALGMAVEQARALMPSEDKTCLCDRCSSGEVRHCPECGPNEGPEDEAVKADCPICGKGDEEGRGAVSL